MVTNIQIYTAKNSVVKSASDLSGALFNCTQTQISTMDCATLKTALFWPKNCKILVKFNTEY